jgi:hypothetical protein
VKRTRVSLALIAAVSGITLGTLVLSGIFSDNHSPGQLLESHSEVTAVSGPLAMPVDIREVYPELKVGGDAQSTPANFVVENNFVNDESHCEFCIAAGYTSGPYVPTTVALKRSIDGIDSALDLSAAKKVTFAARGELGGEKVRIYAAGNQDISISYGDNQSDGPVFGIIIAEPLTLTQEWQEYEVSLQSADLNQITHPFAFEVLAGNANEKQIIYIDHILYSDQNPGK